MRCYLGSALIKPFQKLTSPAIFVSLFREPVGSDSRAVNGKCLAYKHYYFV